MKIKPKLFQHAELDGSSFFWQGNSTGILLVHGFTAATTEVRLMAKYLHENGFTTAGPLLPGHGKTVDEMNRVRWQDWVEAVENTYVELTKNCSKVLVLGESMGALLSMEISIRHPEIAGAMLFAPALITPKLGISEFIWPFKSYIYKSNADESMPWQGFNVYPLHAASQFSKFQRYIKNRLSKVATPTLIFQGRLDHSIDPMGAVQVLETICSEEKELIWLEESTHCILLDKQLPDVETICLDFIKKHI